jgi:hypothetical protein
MCLHKKHPPYTAESGHFICYLNRTYHVLPTILRSKVDNRKSFPYAGPNCEIQDLDGGTYGNRSVNAT